MDAGVARGVPVPAIATPGADPPEPMQLAPHLKNRTTVRKTWYDRTVMDHALQTSLVHRVLAHLERRTTDHEPEPSRLAIGAYADPVRLEREIGKLFRELPLAIAHASTLAQPGDFISHDASGVPLLVVRGDDGVVRAFVNICRHRGTRVEGAPCGSKKAFTCPYHHWTYGRDGSLLAQPHAGGFAGLGQRNLVEVPAAEHAGLIFVRPTPGEPLDLARWLGSLVPDLEGFGLATGYVYAPIVKTRELSWKLAIDIFLEAYHLRTAHRDSIYRLFFDNIGLVDTNGPHLRTVFPKRSIRELPARPSAEWRLREHANILYHLFPNTLVLVQPDHVSMFHAWPLGPARTVIQSYTLVAEPPATEKAQRYWDANNAILYGATEEDFTLGESIQRGLASGANSELTFGAFEHALTHFHAQIAELARAPRGESHRGAIQERP